MTNRVMNVSDGRVRAVIECVTPSIDNGRFAAKRMISNLKAMVIEIGIMLTQLGGKKDVGQSIKQVKDLKNECEMLLLSGLAELYDNPNPDNIAILEALKWTHVYDRIDKAIMRTWGLAKVIEGIVLKNA